MPSSKKRINLTVPDAIYEQLQVYKEANGITNDASACLQLVVQQLKSQEQSKAMMNALLALSADEVAKLSAEGAVSLRKIAEKTAGK